MKWEKKTLGEIITLKRGYDLPSQSRKAGNFPIISSAGITDYHSEFAVTGEGVITGRYGTLGKIFYIDGDYWPLNTTLYVQDFKYNFPKFIYYFLQTLQIEKFNAASAVPGLDRNVLHKIEVNFISDKPTQRKIASFLSAYDDLIENNLKRIKLLETAAELIYKTEFDFFKPSNEVNSLPAGWKVQKADELFSIKIGKTPPREQTEWFNDIDSGVKWVSIKDINNSSVFILETNETVTEMAANKFNMNVAKVDTVILSFKLTVGKVAITTEEMVTNEAIAHFNIADLRMNFEFIYFYLKNFPYDSLGSTSSIGTAINSKIVKAMPVLLPPKSIIQEFGKNVRPNFLQIKNLLKQNVKLREARDILLPKLMNGEIEVTMSKLTN